MELFGQIVIYIIMACAVTGAVFSIVKEDHPIGQKFLEGIDSIGPIFLPVAGILAAAPFLTGFVTSVFGPLYEAIGADASMAATTIIAVDMGGYQLADAIAATRESWIMALTTGYMAGATIIFSIPVALKMLKKEDRKYLALGVMSGMLTIPVGVFISCAIIALTDPMIREVVSTSGAGTYQLVLSFGLIFRNLVPLIIFCVAIAIGLLLKPNAMIKGFLIFGKAMDSAIRLVFVFAVVEYFTGFFSTVIGHWGFDPIIADTAEPFRALEVAGYIGIMLCGAFPMVYMIQIYLHRPLNALGKRLGLSADATTGILAATANVLALFAIVKDLVPEDKVKCIAYAVCSAFLIGDHLSFTANFQPSLILPVMAGKFLGGCLGVYLATKIAVPRARILAEKDLELAAAKKADIETASAGA
ncbi:MAG TPA: ethanolamine utilization protein EutH [Clostridiales bacterium]|nr:ethanolamine utilization protein EutH [Clostridiales bacterium]